MSRLATAPEVAKFVNRDDRMLKYLLGFVDWVAERKITKVTDEVADEYLQFVAEDSQSETFAAGFKKHFEALRSASASDRPNGTPPA